MGNQIASQTATLHTGPEPWSEWIVTIQGYTYALDGRFADLMVAAQTSTLPIGTPTLARDTHLSKQLYYILAMLVKDRAMEKINATPERNGLEVWRISSPRKTTGSQP